MKKLRLFDSLKLVLATVACMFAIVPAHAATLPAGYTELEYIESTGTQYIDTGVVPANKKIGAIIDFQFTSTTKTAAGVFGSNSQDNINNIQFTVFSSKWRYKINDFGAYGSEYDTNRHTVSLNMADGTKFDGNVVTSTQYIIDSTNTKNCFLGACSYNGAPKDAHDTYVLIGKIYSAKVYDDTTLVRNYIPCRRNSDNVIGMYDTVSGRFFTNAGTGEFVAGPDVIPQIKIATTKYNEQQFAPVETRLDAAVAAVDTVVTQTMTQAQQIDQIATNKQTRPDEGCPAKYCLLVEDEQGVPHWYPIAGANGVEYVLPAGYTQLTYIQSDGRQMINTGYVLQETDSVEVDYKLTDLTRTGDKFILGAQPVSGAPGGFWVETYNDTNDWYVRYGSSVSANTYGSVTLLSGTLAVSKNSFVVNGVKILTPDFVSMPANPMTIFNRISLDGSIPNNGASAQISEVRVKNGNNFVHRYIPVRNSNNELGMYDTVSGQFFTNAGTGTFTAGPDM